MNSHTWLNTLYTKWEHPSSLPRSDHYLMIEITPSLYIDEQELEFAFTRSAGPGGQNVNKVSTAVQLRFNVRNSTSLPAEVKQRLGRLAGKRMASEGILMIEARQYRSQEQNRQAALGRVVRPLQQ